jgi:cell wall-associated NlpC family hydrolase
MDMGDRIAAQAQSLVGVPFRLRGRSETTGLDCVGLALLAVMRAGGRGIEPPTYGLRGMTQAQAEGFLLRAGLAPVSRAAPGDVVLVESGPMQLHLMISVEKGLVHAHASLGRVVLMPQPSPWPVLGLWRLPDVPEPAMTEEI